MPVDQNTSGAMLFPLPSEIFAECEHLHRPSHYALTVPHKSASKKKSLIWPEGIPCGGQIMSSLESDP